MYPPPAAGNPTERLNRARLEGRRDSPRDRGDEVELGSEPQLAEPAHPVVVDPIGLAPHPRRDVRGPRESRARVARGCSACWPAGRRRSSRTAPAAAVRRSARRTRPMRPPRPGSDRGGARSPGSGSAAAAGGPRGSSCMAASRSSSSHPAGIPGGLVLAPGGRLHRLPQRDGLADLVRPHDAHEGEVREHLGQQLGERQVAVAGDVAQQADEVAEVAPHQLGREHPVRRRARSPSPTRGSGRRRCGSRAATAAADRRRCRARRADRGSTCRRRR